MFTGLTLGLAKVLKKTTKMGGLELSLKPEFTWESPLVIGESIAVSGCCLTVETVLEGGGFTAFASAETLKNTVLGSEKTFNLERALRLSDRLGGHMVSGHVDSLATITSLKPIGLSLEITFEIEENLIKFVIPKGSVTLDGVSLTVNEIIKNSFTVNLIPETLKVTTLGLKKIGAKVNFEADLVGKYIYQFVSVANNKSNKNSQKESKLTLEFLKENGFY